MLSRNQCVAIVGVAGLCIFVSVTTFCLHDRISALVDPPKPVVHAIPKIVRQREATVLSYEHWVIFWITEMYMLLLDGGFYCAACVAHATFVIIFYSVRLMFMGVNAMHYAIQVVGILLCIYHVKDIVHVLCSGCTSARSYLKSKARSIINHILDATPKEPLNEYVKKD